MVKKKNKIPINMVIDPELKAKVKAAADAEHLSFGAFVSNALREKLGVK